MIQGQSHREEKTQKELKLTSLPDVDVGIEDFKKMQETDDTLLCYRKLAGKKFRQPTRKMVLFL